MEPKTVDTWSDLQAFKRRQTHLREKMQRRKREREDILTGSITHTHTVTQSTTLSQSMSTTLSQPNIQTLDSFSSIDTTNIEQMERKLLQYLCDSALKLPIDSNALTCYVSKNCNIDNCHELVKNLLQKFALQELISLNESLNPETELYLIISSVDHSKLISFGHEVSAKIDDSFQSKRIKRSLNDSEKNDSKSAKSETKTDNCDDLLESLLSSSTIREKENKKMGEEILALLSKPTAKERSLVEQFQSVGGAQVQEFCQHGTKDECVKVNNTVRACNRLHFKKIIEKHTDESLGDCSFLNTCFHMDTCKYVHYKVDYSNLKPNHSAMNEQSNISKLELRFKHILYPPQWIRADLRFFDTSILGKFSVVMADPPWDIHMELPYGTMSDDEMRGLDIPSLQEEGIIFLWVTGRAMELGRECLRLWGYERCDEIIWVKTNQLQRIIRTGRTGHWINHGKEHCLVGVKGNPPEINRGLDCDVIVAEVRATSHKPDEIYGIIERLSPGTRKIELFGRQHNTQPNWVTLGNQLEGVRLIDPVLANAYRKKYPEEAEQLIKESQEFVDKSKDL